MILRDKLLNWQYHDYDNSYKSVKKYKELQGIDIARKQFKEKLKQNIIDEFKIKFADELNSNELQMTLQKIVDHCYSFSIINYDSFIKVRAKEYFETRNSEIIERDTFGYTDINSYESYLKTSLQLAIEDLQMTSKADCVELFLKFLRVKIDAGKDGKYHGNMEDDLHFYVSDLFDGRTQDKISDDRSKLIVLETYLAWRHSAIKQIGEEYPKQFEDDDCGDNESFDTSNSEFEKYGGYNGFDDDTIDNAFEGDPSNTWNVD